MLFLKSLIDGCHRLDGLSFVGRFLDACFGLLSLAWGDTLLASLFLFDDHLVEDVVARWVFIRLVDHLLAEVYTSHLADLKGTIEAHVRA